MKIKNILIVFAFFFLVDLLIRSISPLFIPFYDRFAYLNNALPKVLQSYGNFDGVHYLNIAKLGYANLDFVFLPLYPILIYFATFISKNYLISGIAISAACFFIGLIYLIKIYHLLFTDKKNLTWMLFFILIFPTSFFFLSVYSEGLFFVISACYFYYLFKKKYLLTAIFGFLAPLTKLIGVFLVIPFFICVLIKNFRINFGYLKKMLTDPLKFFAFISPIIGLLTYSLYLFFSKRDPLSFINLHASFGANRSNHIILLPQIYFRYLKIFLTASLNLQYFIAIIEFVFFNFALIVLISDLLLILREKNNQKIMRLVINVFSSIVIIVPTLTGTFLSLPRFILIAFSFYFYLANIKNNWIKALLSLIFVIVHIVLLALFTQGYFIS